MHSACACTHVHVHMYIHVYMHVHTHTCALCGCTRHLRTCRYAAVDVNLPSRISQDAVAAVNNRGRVQSSDWPMQLLFRIKRVLNIAFIYSFRHPNFIMFIYSFSQPTNKSIGQVFN